MSKSTNPKPDNQVKATQVATCSKLELKIRQIRDSQYPDLAGSNDPPPPRQAPKKRPPVARLAFVPESQRRKNKKKRSKKKHSLIPPQLRKIQQRLARSPYKDEKPIWCPEYIYRMNREIKADPTSWSVENHLRQCKHQVARAVIERAATNHGEYSYNGTDRLAVTARNTVILGLALVFLATKIEDYLGGKWKFIVKTIPQSLLCRILIDPFNGKIPDRSLLTRNKAKHDKTATDTSVGILVRLRNEGLFKSEQTVRKATAADPIEWTKPARKGSKKRLVVSVNRYEIITDEVEDEETDEEFREEIARLHYEGGLIDNFKQNWIPLGPEIKSHSPP
jgi:hypothetical protein